MFCNYIHTSDEITLLGYGHFGNAVHVFRDLNTDILTIKNPRAVIVHQSHDHASVLSAHLDLIGRYPGALRMPMPGEGGEFFLIRETGQVWDVKTLRARGHHGLTAVPWMWADAYTQTDFDWIREDVTIQQRKPFVIYVRGDTVGYGRTWAAFEPGVDTLIVSEHDTLAAARIRFISLVEAGLRGEAFELPPGERSRLVMCADTNVIYRSAVAAAKAAGVSKNRMYLALSGGTRVGGQMYHYLDSEERREPRPAMRPVVREDGVSYPSITAAAIAAGVSYGRMHAAINTRRAKVGGKRYTPRLPLA